MPVPAGYTLDSPASGAVNLPAGYTLDQPAQATSQPGGDLANVPGALPGMQTPQQAAGPQPQQLHGTSIDYGKVLAIPQVALGAAKGAAATSNMLNRMYFGDPNDPTNNLVVHPSNEATPEQQQQRLTPQNPAQKGGYIAEKVAELAAPAPKLAEAAAPLTDAAGDAISALNYKGKIANAKQLFATVAKDANQVPVELTNSQEGALNLMEWQKSTNLGPTINKFLNRITAPNQGPLTYAEARQRYQLLGKLSVDEANKLAPAIKRDLVQMVVGLKQDIGNAADTVGQAANYYQAMGDMATGKRLEGWADFAKKSAIKAAFGGGLLYDIYKHVQ